MLYFYYDMQPIIFTGGLESHMFASQWFLTVFTAKFPLFLVFRVLDVFLLQGFDAIFQVHHQPPQFVIINFARISNISLSYRLP